MLNTNYRAGLDLTKSLSPSKQNVNYQGLAPIPSQFPQILRETPISKGLLNIGSGIMLKTD